MNRWKILAVALAAALVAVLGSAALDSASAIRQPQMQAALQKLRAARRHLEQATPDKGGHRGKAMDLVGQAIGEVEAGIAYDASHP